MRHKYWIKWYLFLTSEFLLLLFTHPVDSEAGGGSQPTPKDLLMGLGPLVGSCTWVLCKQQTHNVSVHHNYLSILCCRLMLSLVLCAGFSLCMWTKTPCNYWLTASMFTVLWHTGDRWRTGAALAAQLLQGVDSYVEVDVLTAAALIHQPLLVQSLKQELTLLSLSKLESSLLKD